MKQELTNKFRVWIKFVKGLGCFWAHSTHNLRNLRGVVLHVGQISQNHLHLIIFDIYQQISIDILASFWGRRVVDNFNPLFFFFSFLFQLHSVKQFQFPGSSQRLFHDCPIIDIQNKKKRKRRRSGKSKEKILVNKLFNLRFRIRKWNRAQSKKKKKRRKSEKTKHLLPFWRFWVILSDGLTQECVDCVEFLLSLGSELMQEKASFIFSFFIPIGMKIEQQ